MVGYHKTVILLRMRQITLIFSLDQKCLSHHRTAFLTYCRLLTFALRSHLYLAPARVALPIKWRHWLASIVIVLEMAYNMC